MQERRRIFDDAAVLAGGVLGALSGIRREARDGLRHQADRLLSEMDFVTRDEFNAVKEMAVKARVEQEHLAEQIRRLQGAIDDLARTGAQNEAIREEWETAKDAAGKLEQRQQAVETRVAALEAVSSEPGPSRAATVDQADCAGPPGEA